MTRRRRPALAAAAAAALLAPAAPAAAHDEHCHGTTVVVDFGPGGPEPAVGCADDPATGIEALTQAGFTVVEVAAFPGLVCRIDGHPDTECGAAPPADASWSYWLADGPDDEWRFATVGPAGHDPADGDLEGWAFGGTTAAPALTPREAAGAETAAEPADDTDAPPTWIAAAIALSAITGLVVWRLRRDRRA